MSETEQSAAPDKGVLQVVFEKGQDADAVIAKAVLSPGLASATVAGHWMQRFAGEDQPSLMGTIRTLEASAALVNKGDLSEVEARLLSQATALDAMFVEMSRRASLQVGKTGGQEAFERYFKLALKAQNQSRMTLETLGNIKNPRVVFAKQANFAGGQQQINNAAGPQQVNNGTPPRAPAQETETVPSKLLEQSNEQWLVVGAPGQAGGGDSQLATVATGNRT